MPGLPAFGALDGCWRVTRSIRHAGGGTDRFAGETRFTRAGARILQDEDGWLTLASGARLRATRRYLWMRREGGAECLFPDGRPFHSLPFGVARPETTYLCPPDRYAAAYDFTRWPEWRVTWTVEGPAKDYVMESRMVRA